MGASLFERFPDWTSQADEVLGYSIRTLCLEDPDNVLGQTAFTQCALFVVNAMTYRARLEDGAVPPAYVAGHSLGEYNALLAAGVFDFQAGVRLVQRRGQLMGTITGGGMAAVVGLTPDQIAGVLEGSEPGRRLDIANFNSFDQTVIAGPSDDIAAVQPAFDAAGVRMFKALKVSAPFHSRYMRDPMIEFTTFMDRFDFRAPSIPVISNVTAEPYAAIAVRETLGRQIGQSVRWLDSMIYLLEHGVTDFAETGPGKVLTKLLAQIRKVRER
jgi:trans-AT polyketide synthase/acyltransferase/oxidoreductase domain-containing protein